MTAATAPSASDMLSRDSLAPQRMLAPQTYGLTHPGRVRDNNEDQFLIAVLTKTLQVVQSSLPQPRLQYGGDRGYLFVVADGMGGHAAGERASALAIHTIEGFMLDALKWFSQLRGEEGNAVLHEFQQAVSQADAALFAEAERHPELHGMGTTFTMAYSLHDDLFVAHVGDSRGYLLRRGQMYRMTHDHTMVDEMVQRGLLSPEEAAGHRLRHIITNALGGRDPGVRVELHKIRLEPGDVLLLCSDGLTEMVPDAEIAAVLHGEPGPWEACETLVARANERGGKDNITVVVARYEAA